MARPAAVSGPAEVQPIAELPTVGTRLEPTIEIATPEPPAVESAGTPPPPPVLRRPGLGAPFAPRAPAPIGASDPTDLDLQPGGDNVCRYRYVRNDIDYLYPTTPPNPLTLPGVRGIANQRR